MNTRLFQELILYRHRYKIAYLAMILLAFGALVYRLGGLLPGISLLEAQRGLQSLSGLQGILEQPVNAPYSLVQYISILTLGSTDVALRIASVVFAVILLSFLFGLLSKWHKPRIAIISVLFASSSSWFLHAGRLGDDYIMLPLSLVVLLYAMTQLRHTVNPRRSIAAAVILISLTLYTPYMIYFLLLSLFLYRKYIIEKLIYFKVWQLFVGGLIPLILLMPLFIGIFKDVGNLKLILGIPDTLPSIIEYFKNAQGVFAHIFWRSVDEPQGHLGTIAMLDIFTATMTALGFYHYERHFSQLRTRVLFFGFITGFLMLALAADQGTYVLLLPFIYIYAATGIITLLTQWYNIFPQNPFARTVAILPLSLALVLSVNYHLNRYFIAWARSPITKAAFAPDTTVLIRDMYKKLEPETPIVIVAPAEMSEIIKYSTSRMELPLKIQIVEEADEDIGSSLLYAHYTTNRKPLTKKYSAPKRYIATDRASDSIAYYLYVKE